MKNYSMGDAAQVLGVDTETLHQWLIHDDLKLTVDPHDSEQLQLDQEQVDLLARTHVRPSLDRDMQQQEKSSLPSQEERSIRVDALRLNRIVNEHTLLLHDISLTIPQRAFVALVGGSATGDITPDGQTSTVPAKVIVIADNHPANSLATRGYTIAYGTGQQVFSLADSIIFSPY